jgi:hypothetical protein
MTYTYDIENKDGRYAVQIVYTTENNKEGHGRFFNTEAEAETWATAAIQAMKDNNNVFVNEPF